MAGPWPALPLDEDRSPHLPATRPHLVDDGQEGIAREHGGRVRIIEGIGHFLSHQPVVHGHGQGPGGTDGCAGEQVLEGVLRVDHDVLARLDPQRGKRAGQPVPRAEKLAPGDEAGALGGEGLVGMSRRVHGDDAHGELEPILGLAAREGQARRPGRRIGRIIKGSRRSQGPRRRRGASWPRCRGCGSTPMELVHPAWNADMAPGASRTDAKEGRGGAERARRSDRQSSGGTTTPCGSRRRCRGRRRRRAGSRDRCWSGR
jgi:hypothetical protein